MSIASAVQILSCTDHLLNVHLTDIKLILGSDDIKDRIVVVLSIAGCLREGKSFLLNFFLKYLNAQYKKHDASDWIGEKTTNEELNGFKWRGGKHPETNGIWMWSEIFTHDFDDGQKIAIILLDTQGIFDNKSSLKDCISIFGISMLLSSVQCYNVMRNVNENHLQNLQLFTEYARIAMNESEEKPFQKLLFIIRDWPWPQDNAYGYSKEYIDEKLVDNKNCTKEMRQLRQRIESSFNEIDAFLLPEPGSAVRQQANFNGNLQKIEKNFVEKVKELVPSLLAPDQLTLKKVGGGYVRARDFVNYLETYVNTFNGSELPQPISLLMATAEVSIRTLYEQCLEIYTNLMQEAFESVETFLKDDELNKLHENMKTHTITKFRNKRKLGGELLITEWEEKLQIGIRHKFEHYQNVNTTKRDKINSNKNKIVGYAATAGSWIGGAALVPFVGAELGIAALIARGVMAVGGGAGISALITKGLTAVLPDRWFKPNSIEDSDVALPATQSQHESERNSTTITMDKAKEFVITTAIKGFQAVTRFFNRQ